MKILICGASGFVGRHLLAALEQAGHTCVRGLRKPGNSNNLGIDYTRDTEVETWLPRLAGIDVVINAIGVLRDSQAQPMQKVHGDAPAALFAACVQAGVKRVVQVSALGVGGEVETQYLRTKAVADQALIAAPKKLRYLILRPSAIFGLDGSSARMFVLQAKMPIQPLPCGGGQLLQPVHVDDLATAVVNWLNGEQALSAIVTATGAEVVTMAEMLRSYRRQSGYGAAWQIAVPGLLMKWAAKCGDLIPASPLSTENLLMLNAGSVGDSAAFAKLLGREPRSVHTFIKASEPEPSAAP